MQHLDLDGSATRKSWEWLADVAPRLDIVIEMVDVDGAPGLLAGSTPDAAAFRSMLAGGEATIAAAVSDVRGSTNRVFLSADSFQAHCCGLTTGTVLLLARNLTGAESVAECRQDLESIGNWLSGAVEATLAQTSAISVEPYRIVSFKRILRDATSRGSIRTVIGAFVEALSVWDDVRVRCYIAGANGGLVEYGSPLESLPSPHEPDESAVPQHGRMVRVPRAEADRLGLVPEPGDTIVFRMLVGDIPWLLVFSGMIDEPEQIRLRLYSDFLRESLSKVAMVTTSRLVAEVSRSRRATNETPEFEAQTALQQLMNAMACHRGALALSTASGKQTIAVGDVDLLRLETLRRDQMMIKSSDGDSVLTAVFDRDQVPFTAFERELALAGAAVVRRWMQSSVQSSDMERRRRARAVDAVFDQLATDAIATGRHASVIVVSLDETRLRPGLLPRWVGRIRGRLRAGDYAGMLSDREIAVLLCGASEDHAAAVSARLTDMFQSDDVSGAFLDSAIGMTTRTPDSAFQGSIVGAARALASAHH
jgi:hypothetical protein